MNTSAHFVATGIYSDNTTRDLTSSVFWSSSAVDVTAGIQEARFTGLNASGSTKPGNVTATQSGKAKINGKWGTLSGSTDVTVTTATIVSLEITPADPSIALGTTNQFKVIGTFSDNTTQDLTTDAAWNSSDATVAAISNVAGSKGLATSTAAGTTTITAAFGGVSASSALTVNPVVLVSITVTPTNPSIVRGTNQQFTANGTYSDNSTQDLTTEVTWNSANASVATISNMAGSNGLAASAAAGTTTISATSGSISGSAVLTVKTATLVTLAISPANPSIAANASQQFIATGTYSDGSTQNLTAAVTWSSSNIAVAQISNAAGSKGLTTGIAAGSTSITGIFGGVSGSAALTVTPASGGATTISLAWDAPTTRPDGTPLTGLAGYKIYYGTSSGNYITVLDAGNTTDYVINNLSPGTYYIVTTAYYASGGESGYSNEVSKTIQ